MKEPVLSTTERAAVPSSTSTVVLIVVAVWLAAAVAVAASGVLEDPPAPVPPVLIWGPVVAFVVVFIRSQTFRIWTLELNPSSPSEKHGWRVLEGMMGPVQ